MKLLVHTCCAPCLTFPSEKLKVNNWDITVFFFNPNIHPYTEYKLRRDCLEDYCSAKGIRFVESSYDIDSFFQKVVFREHARCSMCYNLRLAEAAKVAKSGKYDSFTTTLLVSPYQKHEMIHEIGNSVGGKYDIPFYYYDFRKGWKQTIAASKELGLYRQKYCGCIYSENERFNKTMLGTGT